MLEVNTYINLSPYGSSLSQYFIMRCLIHALQTDRKWSLRWGRRLTLVSSLGKQCPWGWGLSERRCVWCARLVCDVSASVFTPVNVTSNIYETQRMKGGGNGAFNGGRISWMWRHVATLTVSSPVTTQSGDIWLTGGVSKHLCPSLLVNSSLSVSRWNINACRSCSPRVTQPITDVLLTGRQPSSWRQTAGSATCHRHSVRHQHGQTDWQTWSRLRQSHDQRTTTLRRGGRDDDETAAGSWNKSCWERDTDHYYLLTNDLLITELKINYFIRARLEPAFRIQIKLLFDFTFTVWDSFNFHHSLQ